MKSNTFNICPTCVYKDSCVLTTQKSQVWACSEFQEGEAVLPVEKAPKEIIEVAPEMAMA